MESRKPLRPSQVRSGRAGQVLKSVTTAGSKQAEWANDTGYMLIQTGTPKEIIVYLLFPYKAYIKVTNNPNAATVEHEATVGTKTALGQGITLDANTSRKLIVTTEAIGCVTLEITNIG